MHDIRRVLASASRRLIVVDWLSRLALMLTAAVVVLIGALLAERLFGVFIAWREWAIGAVCGAVVVAAAWAFVERRQGLGLAQEVDTRAGLRESLSTALVVADRDDQWSRAVVETAIDRARRVNVAQAVPITAPRLWHMPLTAGLAMLVLFLSVPTVDVLGLLAQREDEQQEQAQIAQAKAEVKAQQDRLEDLLAKAGIKDGQGDHRKEDQAEPRSADDIRRAAVRDLTRKAELLKKAAEGEKGQTLDAMREKMRQLRQPGPGPLGEFSKAMARGEFAKAQEELAKLAEKMQSGELTAEQQARLQEQLRQMADQLAKLAEQRDSLEQQLRQAGMSAEQAKQMAADPASLTQALQNNQNLTQEQKDKLQQAAEAMNSACSACNNMGQSMNKMCSGMNPGQSGMQGLSELAGQLSDMEMLQGEMTALDAAMSECQGQMSGLGQCMGGQCSGLSMAQLKDKMPGTPSVGQWKPGDSSQQGMGSGSAGKGNGAPSPPEEEAPFNIVKHKSPTNNQGGPIIGSRYVQGEQVRGESLVELTDAVAQAQNVASEAIETGLVPKELESAAKHYFGCLEARLREQNRAPAPPPPDDAKDKGE